MIYGTVGLGKICFTVLDAEEETFREGGFLSPVERDIERHAEVCQLEHVLQGSQEERQDSLARQLRRKADSGVGVGQVVSKCVSSTPTIRF